MPRSARFSLRPLGRLASSEGRKAFLRCLPGLVWAPADSQSFLILRFGLIRLPFVIVDPGEINVGPGQHHRVIGGWMLARREPSTDFVDTHSLVIPPRPPCCGL